MVELKSDIMVTNRDKQVKFILNAESEDELEKVVTVKNGLELRVRDFKTILGREWLNDAVVNAYMRLASKHFSLVTKREIGHIDPLIFRGILESGIDSCIARGAIEREDIFKLDLILVPVYRHHHWCLASINLKEKKLSYYDSLKGRQINCFEAILEYMNACHLHHHKKPITEDEWILLDTFNDESVPRQNNSDDCGVFICAYAEHIMADREFNFGQEDMQGYRKKLFASLFRGVIWEPVDSKPTLEPSQSETGVMLRERPVTVNLPDHNMQRNIYPDSPLSLSGINMKIEEMALIDMAELMLKKSESETQPKWSIELPKSEFLRIMGHETSRRGVKFDIVPPNSGKVVKYVTDSEVKKLDPMVLFEYIYRLSREKPRVWNYMKHRSVIARELMIEGFDKRWHKKDDPSL